MDGMKKTTAVAHANGPNLDNETPYGHTDVVHVLLAADPNRLNELGKKKPLHQSVVEHSMY